MRLGISLGIASGMLTVLIAACVGDEPVTSAPGGPDGGGDAPVVGPSDGSPVGDDASPDAAPDAGGCGDTMTSAQNCGACGHACAQGFACTAGHCGEEVVELVSSRGFPPTGYHSQLFCAVLRSGALYCWGDNSDSQLGVPSVSPFANEATAVDKDANDAGFGGVVEVAGAESTTCTVDKAGAGWCWGADSSGQYGSGASGGASALPKQTVDAGPGVAFRRIAATLAAFCGIDAAGELWCWGYNNEDELGHDRASDPAEGSSSTPHNPTPRKVVFPFAAGTDKVVQVVGGPVHACALVQSGHVYCWGHDQWGNVGNASATDPQPTPLLVAGPNGETTGLGGVVELAAGSDFTCARTSAKTMYCWGYGGNGNCGNGASNNVNAHPVQVKGPGGTGVLAGVEAIGAGWFHACAVVTSGNVYCWGTNSKGELGIGAADGTVRNTPTDMVKGPTGGSTVLGDVVALTGARATTCALKKDDTIWCWGENAYDTSHGGYLGNADPNHADSPLPVQVHGLP